MEQKLRNSCSVCFQDFRCENENSEVPWHESFDSKECVGSNTQAATREVEDARMDAASHRSDELLAEALEKLVKEYPEYSLDQASAEIDYSHRKLRKHLWKEIAPMLKAWMEGG